MMITLKNSWKLFAESATGSKAKGVHRTFRFTLNNADLKLFFLFFSTLCVTYAAIDAITNRVFESLGYAFANNHSSVQILKTLGSQLLMHVRETDMLTKISVFFSIVLAASWLTLMTSKPIKQSDIRQKHFTSNVAHELNTPLSIQRATAEVMLMKKNELSTAETSEFATLVIEEVDRMSEIVKYFLRFTSKEKKLELYMSPVNITSVVNKVARTLAWLSTECEVTVELPKEGEEIVWGNLAALEEMITNFTKNAITHSPAGGVVKLSLKNSVNYVSLSVFNEGPGIDPADLPYIFDPFYKGEDVLHFRRLGLGLTIASEIAKMHLTRIEVRSHPTTGTEFTVKLPK